MTLRELVQKIPLKILSGEDLLDRPVTGGYASDLLSDVLANSREGHIWITLQIHKNILGVATVRELSAVLIVNGRVPEEDVLNKAHEERIPILGTDMGTFQIAARLGECGIR